MFARAKVLPTASPDFICHRISRCAGGEKARFCAESRENAVARFHAVASGVLLPPSRTSLPAE